MFAAGGLGPQPVTTYDIASAPVVISSGPIAGFTLPDGTHSRAVTLTGPNFRTVPNATSAPSGGGIYFNATGRPAFLVTPDVGATIPTPPDFTATGLNLKFAICGTYATPDEFFADVEKAQEAVAQYYQN